MKPTLDNIRYMQSAEYLYRAWTEQPRNKELFVRQLYDAINIHPDNTNRSVITHAPIEPLRLQLDEQLADGLAVMQTFVDRFGSFLADNSAVRRGIGRRTKKLVLPSVQFNGETRRITVFDQLRGGLHCMIESVDEQGAPDDSRTIHITKSYAGEVFVLDGDLAHDAALGTRRYARLVTSANTAIEQYFGHGSAVLETELDVTTSIGQISKAVGKEQRRRLGRQAVRRIGGAAVRVIEAYGRQLNPDR